MKKLFGLVLTGAMVVSLAACGGGNAKETSAVETSTIEVTESETTAAEETSEAEEASGAETSAEAVADAGTLGETLLHDFEVRVGENSEATALELAEGIIANEKILFSGGAVSVEEGLLTGFGNTEITGFEEGAMFAPMIGTIPFVGYVFDMEDAAGAEALVEVLTEHANPRWNICTEAEETVVGTVEDKVFFVMCPKSLEE